MTRTSTASVLATLLASLLAGCQKDGSDGIASSKPEGANRGEFTAIACAEGERVAVPASAVVAVYLDIDHAVVGTQAEDMAGTEHNMMCPVNELPALDANCPTGQCPYSPPGLGKTYCLTRPLPCP